jgi:hypothetical protein
VAVTSIQFIEEPPYTVDFIKYLKENPVASVSFVSRIESAVIAPFVFTKMFFVCVGQAGYETVSHLGVSFKYIVLGYYGSFNNWRLTRDVYLIGVKIMFWIAAGVWCFITTTARLLHEESRKDLHVDSFLSQFAGDEIDVSHIVTHDLEIDVSAVSPEVSVDNLLRMFDEINFNDVQAPGYMPPSNRKEENTTYTIPELKEGIKKFVGNVNQRVAFLGTPPAWDMPRLLVFYQQVENIVRFAIQKSNKDLSDFQVTNGCDSSGYEKEDLRKYKNILEDRARIVLTFAIAGKHCGARYMGDAIEVYAMSKNEDSIVGENLQDTLTEILAAKRKEIAHQQIQTHFGADVHAYTNYMSTLGRTLAIPGMGNVIEHLAASLDASKFLRLFFLEYTVDSIIATVQDKVKSSQKLREQIGDWLRAQKGDWQPVKKDSLDDRIAEAKAALENSFSIKNSIYYSAFNDLSDLLAYIEKNKLPFENDLDEFIASRNDFFSKKYSDAIQRTKVKSQIKDLLLHIELEKESVIDQVFQYVLELEKILELCSCTGLNRDTAMRVVKNEKDLKEALEEKCTQDQTDKFAELLGCQDFADKGLSKEMVEWILVSQGILLTQVRV